MLDARRARRTYIPVSFTAASIEDEFWAPRIRVNRERTIPAEYRQCQETGRIHALKLDWKPGQQPVPHIFWDSDIAKWIEAASYSLATHPDPALDAQLDEVIALLASAQQPMAISTLTLRSSSRRSVGPTCAIGTSFTARAI